MGLLNVMLNYVNASIGRKQDFDKLIASKDIGRIKDSMETKSDKIFEALREYDPSSHDIMRREDKIITDKSGKFLRKESVWKLPIAYQPFINEISLVFLYGRPVKWMQLSEGTDNAFSAFTNFIKRTRFDSKIRACKRIAGAETQSAMLFRVFRNNDSEPDCQIRVLAKSKGDDIYVRWDQYENIISIGWGYYVTEDGKTNYHFDIYTDNVIYRCRSLIMGWEVVEEHNPIGKIPIILFQQEKEWKGVESMIHREEYIGSRTADTNDYFADPIAIMDADVIKNMPEKKDANKLLVTKGAEGVDKVAKYLTWDSAPESKKLEIEWLQKHILSKSFTPNIDFDNMKGLSNVSGKALKQMMILADIKASKHKEVHDELLDRSASLSLAIIGNVLDVSLGAETKKCIIGHEFQEPFGEDVTEAITNLVKLSDSELISQEGAVELNPFVKDSKKEMERLKKQADSINRSQTNLFQIDKQDEIFPIAE